MSMFDDQRGITVLRYTPVTCDKNELFTNWDASPSTAFQPTINQQKT